MRVGVPTSAGSHPQLSATAGGSGRLVGALELGRQAVVVLETTAEARTLAETRELVAEWERQTAKGTKG